jgi:hypothetical protein
MGKQSLARCGTAAAECHARARHPAPPRHSHPPVTQVEPSVGKGASRTELLVSVAIFLELGPLLRVVSEGRLGVGEWQSATN